MKVHNNLEKLLVDFATTFEYEGNKFLPIQVKWLVKNYLSTNSLALGKTRAVSKKTSRLKRGCEICNGKKLLAYWHKTGMGMKHCECIRLKDASSR